MIILTLTKTVLIQAVVVLEQWILSSIDGLVISYSNLPSDCKSVERHSIGEPFFDCGEIAKNRQLTEGTDFFKSFCLNPQCSSHSWDMMMVEPSWETALVKGQFALFTLIMGQSTCRWHCNESSDARKSHKKMGVFWHSYEIRWSRAILFALGCQQNLTFVYWPFIDIQTKWPLIIWFHSCVRKPLLFGGFYARRLIPCSATGR